MANSLGFLSKLKSILTSPSKFFEEIKTEPGYGPPIKYMLILGVLIIVVQMISQISSSVSAILGFGVILILAPVILGLILFVSVVSSAIYHIIGKIFGIKRGFLETYKATVYGFTPYFIIQALSKLPFYDDLLIVNIYLGSFQLNIFSIWALTLVAIGLSKLHEIEFSKGLAIVYIPVIVGLLIAILLFASLLHFAGLIV